MNYWLHFQNPDAFDTLHSADTAWNILVGEYLQLPPQIRIFQLPINMPDPPPEGHIYFFAQFQCAGGNFMFNGGLHRDKQRLGTVTAVVPKSLIPVQGQKIQRVKGQQNFKIDQVSYRLFEH